MIAILAVLYLAAAATAASTATPTGSVKGVVQDAGGTPIPGSVRVFISQALPANAIRAAAPPVQTGPHVTSRYTDGAGNFRVDSLAPGDYVVCASAATPGYLDPCQWAAAAPSFTVTADQVVANVTVVLAKGAVIPVRVNDAPQKFLKKQDTGTDGDLQIHAVTGTGNHHMALIVAQDDKGRDHTLTVPFGTPLNFQVFSPRLAVGEASGKLSAPGGFGLTVPAGTTPAPIVLTVTGGK